MTSQKSAWIDITMEFGAPAGTFPGDAPFHMEWTARIEQGNSAVNLSKFTSSPHNGTHSDAPVHVIPGAPASESLDVDAYIGPCHVVDATKVQEHLLPPSILDGVDAPRILFKTRTGPHQDRFPEGFRGLSEALAQRLAQQHVKLVGTDAPSMDAQDSKGLPAHHALFRGGLHLLENLDLSRINAGDYELLALPLKVRGLCGAPVRALLRSKP